MNKDNIDTNDDLGQNKVAIFEKELKTAYLDYAMSVIVSRAIPCAFDGLKPVQRRILYAMAEAGYFHSKPHTKCAAVTGEVMQKYHPHGNAAVYDALVRMAQSFSLSTPLIDGQGNFGSIDGDPAAAERYTECRLSKISKYLLTDYDKDTVDTMPNYDNKYTIPTTLAAMFPNLLVNGANGIAVGMATSVPTHNLNEVINATCALIDNPNLTTKELMEYVKGPDFPTGCSISSQSSILKMYQEGKGSVIIRGEVKIENNAIIITEIPYQVNKSKLVEQIVDLSQTDEMKDISEVRDESNLDGIRIVIELKRNANAEIICKNLYLKTQLQIAFHAYMLALDNGIPKQLTLLDILNIFIRNRDKIIIRRTLYLMRQAKARTHILWGLSLAASKMDDIIEYIKQSKNADEARKKLMSIQWNKNDVIEHIQLIGHIIDLDDLIYLTETQVNSILELRLQSLTGLERNKILNELNELGQKIHSLQELLDSQQKRYQMMKEELSTINAEFHSPRRSRIENLQLDQDDLEFIEKEDCVVTISHKGYTKRVPLDVYRVQKRGGKGKRATTESDPTEHLVVANTHQDILLFSTRGFVYSLPSYKIPLANPNTMGRAIVNLVDMETDEKIAAMLPISDYQSESTLFFITSKGYVKRNLISDFESIRRNGKRAIELNEDESLHAVIITNPEDEIMITSSAGKSVRFETEDVRVFTGRKSRGVMGMNLDNNEAVVSSTLIKKGEEDRNILTITSQGFGKRAKIADYRVTNRGTKGVTTTIVTKDTGPVIGAYHVDENDEIILMNNVGQLIRCGLDEVRVVNRRAKGVHMVKLNDGNSIVHAFIIKDIGE